MKLCFDLFNVMEASPTTKCRQNQLVIPGKYYLLVKLIIL